MNKAGHIMIRGTPCSFVSYFSAIFVMAIFVHAKKSKSKTPAYLGLEKVQNSIKQDDEVNQFQAANQLEWWQGRQANLRRTNSAEDRTWNDFGVAIAMKLTVIWTNFEFLGPEKTIKPHMGDSALLWFGILMMKEPEMNFVFIVYSESDTNVRIRSCVPK